VINMQLEEEGEFASEFQYAFSNFFGDAPVNGHQQTAVLKATWINTVLGSMIAIADETALYLLEFVTRRGLKKEVERLRSRGFAIIPGSTAPIQSITRELAAYFDGTLMQFHTPYRVFGSSFQQDVWQTLCNISYGETKSYREQAIDLGRPTAYRAVANANAANQLAIVIPCHRIISSDGSLGGYGGGLAVKQRLIEHEKRHQKG
jgi:AraC family transcriptional regulator, regulatory protein of adaptative response / methylated-DNA-[protein]-cysteine methyltransferase